MQRMSIININQPPRIHARRGDRRRIDNHRIRPRPFHAVGGGIGSAKSAVDARVHEDEHHGCMVGVVPQVGAEGGEGGAEEVGAVGEDVGGGGVVGRGG